MTSANCVTARRISNEAKKTAGPTIVKMLVTGLRWRFCRRVLPDQFGGGQRSRLCSAVSPCGFSPAPETWRSGLTAGRAQPRTGDAVGQAPEFENQRRSVWARRCEADAGTGTQGNRYAEGSRCRSRDSDPACAGPDAPSISATCNHLLVHGAFPTARLRQRAYGRRHRRGWLGTAILHA